MVIFRSAWKCRYALQMMNKWLAAKKKMIPSNRTPDCIGRVGIALYFAACLHTIVVLVLHFSLVFGFLAMQFLVEFPEFCCL